jgi:hypothetical protein
MPPDEPSFTVEDLRRLTDEIGPGEHAAVVLVEHRWAHAARGAALLRALETFGGDEPRVGSHPRAAVAAALVDAGFVRDCEAAEAIDALAQPGIVEQALQHGAVAEAQDEPPQPDA